MRSTDDRSPIGASPAIGTSHRLEAPFPNPHDGELIERLRNILDNTSALPDGRCVLPITGPGSYQAIEATADEAAQALTSKQAAEAERDEALDRVEELERDAEIVSAEFEKDCWKALRSLIERTDPEFDLNRDGDGTTAQDACDFLWEAMESCEKRAQAAEERLLRAVEALGELPKAAERLRSAHNA